MTESSFDRRLSIALFVLAFGLLFVFYPKGNGFVESPQSEIWLQQPSIDKKNLKPIQPNNWDVDFTRLDEVLNDAELNGGDVLPLDDATMVLMRRLQSLLPEPASQKHWQRLHFLIMKSLPGDAGSQLADLVLASLRYEQAHIEFQAQFEKPPANVVEAEQRYRQVIALKEQFFGAEATEKFFGEKHRLALYIYARRKIMADKELTAAQREHQMQQLEKSFNR